MLALCLSLASTWTATQGFSLSMNAANKGKVNVIAGATGYIGKSVVRESVRQGYDTIALVRSAEKVTSPEGKALYGEFLEGAKLVECDVTNPDQLLEVCIYWLCILCLYLYLYFYVHFVRINIALSRGLKSNVCEFFS